MKIMGVQVKIMYFCLKLVLIFNITLVIMKSNLFLVAMMTFFFIQFTSISLFAQEEAKTNPFSVGADLVSSYVWRGSKIGTGPNIQPSLKFSTGGFTLGAWGSTSFHEAGDPAEMDLYALYTFNFGLSIGATDYYYQGTPYFRYETDSSSHALEINMGYTVKNFSVAANYVINDASKGGPANKPGGGDMYFELTYAFKNISVFAGAGNGWHTTYKDNGDDVFTVCNIGIKASKDIKITDKFSLPVTGALSVNPDKEELNLVVGITF
jgi:hypothetical protein